MQRSSCRKGSGGFQLSPHGLGRAAELEDGVEGSVMTSSNAVNDRLNFAASGLT